MRRSVNKTILEVQPYIPGKPIEEVKRELGLTNVIKLASNENPYGPSPKVLKAIEKAALQLNRYPDGDCYYLRQELAKRLGVLPRQLIFGNGSDELIVFAIRAFVEKGDEVIIAKPSFLIYEIASKIAGAVIKAVPLREFRYDLKMMKEAVTDRTKIIFLGNPDNPAGTYFTKQDILGLVKGLREDILVFIDEAYFEYVTTKDYVDSVALLKDHKNIIVTRTFSKLYGLAGLRIGYGISSEEIVDYLNRVREPFNVNSLAQVAAIACLKDQVYYRKIKREVGQQRVFLHKSLAKLGLVFQESHTNFILIRVADASKVAQRLLQKGVIIRDMSFWGLNDFIRVTIGTEKENRKLLSILEEII